MHPYMDASEKPPDESTKTFKPHISVFFIKLRCFCDQLFVAIFRFWVKLEVVETQLLVIYFVVIFL